MYTHEFSQQDHERLLQMILNLKGKALVCAYDNPLYRERLGGWATVKMSGHSMANPRRYGRTLPTRSLTVWMNYDPPRKGR